MTKNTGMVLGGRYKKGTIILKSGAVVSAKELYEAKKAGIPLDKLNEYLESKAVQPAKEPLTNWATVSIEEIQDLRSLAKASPKTPWYRKLFKGGAK